MRAGAMSTHELVPQSPPRVPRGGNAFTRWLGRVLLRLLGWRVTGGFPDEPRFIVIAAPHTSNWDWVVAMPALLALGIRIKYLIKDSAFVWPFSLILRATGGVPIDRNAPEGVVEDLAARVVDTPEIILVITPEGTRRRVEHWKTGFLRIAELAALPVVQVSWDYPSRVIDLGPVVELSGDHDRDIARIRAYYRRFTGCKPENQSP
jgi:1-acyl-sn-glycerol-3-phosphate acyltransferase